MDQRDTFRDVKGRPHQILEFRDLSSFRKEILKLSPAPFFLDIDIDYFIENKVAPYQRKGVQLYSDDRIRSVFDTSGELLKQLLGNLEGITFATEPRYCGGLRNSNHILEVILNQLFTHQMNWKHLI